MKNTTQTTQDTSSHQVRADLLLKLLDSAMGVHTKFTPYAVGSPKIEGRCEQLTHDINLLRSMLDVEVSAAKMQDIDEQREDCMHHLVHDPENPDGAKCSKCNESYNISYSSEPSEHPCPSYEGTERVRITPKGEAMIKESRDMDTVRNDNLQDNEQREYAEPHAQELYQKALASGLDGKAAKREVDRQLTKEWDEDFELYKAEQSESTPAISKSQERYNNLEKALAEYAENSMITNLRNQSFYMLDLMKKYDLDNNGNGRSE